MNRWKRWIVAAFVAFIYYFCQFVRNGSELKRYFSQWDTQDAIVILLGIALLTVLAVAADTLVTWSASRLLRRIFNHIFLLLLASGALGILGYLLDRLNIILLLWMAAMFVIGCSFARPQLKLDLIAAKICYLFSPAILLITVTMFFWSTWSNQRESLPPINSSTPKKTPVYFFVFDEWSYLRSEDDGQFNASLSNLQKLATNSVVFTNTRSPGDETLKSLPCYLFQNDSVLKLDNGKTFFQDDESRIPTVDVPSIFRIAGRQGYRTIMMGFYHSYRHMLGDQVDYCHVYPCFSLTHTTGFYEAFLWRLMRITAYLYDPISLQLRISVRSDSWEWYKTRTEYRKEMLELLAENPSSDFAFFHAPWPHYPFVCNPDGSYFGFRWDSSRSKDYMRELQYLDKLVGEIIDTLRTSEKFDDSLLIFTSDHGWRADSDAEIQNIPDFKRRIPLIIKLPGQKTGQVIDKEFCPNLLKPLLEAVFAGEKDTDKLLKILQDTVDAQQP